jgi:hypothetical protein
MHRADPPSAVGRRLGARNPNPLPASLAAMFTCDNGTAPEPSAPAAVNGYPFAPPTPGYPGPPTPGAPGPAPGEW